MQIGEYLKPKTSPYWSPFRVEDGRGETRGGANLLVLSFVSARRVVACIGAKVGLAGEAMERSVGGGRVRTP